jgi:hypothetical protein
MFNNLIVILMEIARGNIIHNSLANSLWILDVHALLIKKIANRGGGNCDPKRK